MVPGQLQLQTIAFTAETPDGQWQVCVSTGIDCVGSYTEGVA
jgi:hypothetical protein